jgi:CRP/FNR family transcriptional regulator, cyclic AMP receptor protein
MHLKPVSPQAPDGRLAYSALRDVPGWLADQPEDFARQLLQMARLVSFARGETIFTKDDPPGGIYGIISGGVGIEGGGDFHTVRLGHVLRTGAWFGHHPILAPGQRRVQTMRATEDSALVHVPLAPLETLVRADPIAARCIGNMADGGSMLATRIISDLLIPHAPQRVAAVLLRVTGAEQGIIPTHKDGFLMTQDDLGEMANVSRQHLNRVLSDLRKKGWIAMQYQRLRVIDAAALRAFAATDA